MVIRSTVSIMFVQNVDEIIFESCCAEEIKEEVKKTKFRLQRWSSYFNYSRTRANQVEQTYIHYGDRPPLPLSLPLSASLSSSLSFSVHPSLSLFSLSLAFSLSFTLSRARARTRSLSRLLSIALVCSRVLSLRRTDIHTIGFSPSHPIPSPPLSGLLSMSRSH